MTFIQRFLKFVRTIAYLLMSKFNLLLVNTQTKSDRVFQNENIADKILLIKDKYRLRHRDNEYVALNRWIEACRLRF
jgi:hypothetical protein